MPSVYSTEVFSRVVQATPISLRNVIVALGIYNFGWGFADPFFSQFLRTFSENYETVGLLAALINGVTMLMVIPVGGLLERISRRQVFDIGRWGYVLVGTLYFLSGLFHSTPLLICALICNGIFLPFVWTSAISIVEGESGEKNASMTYGLYTTMRQLLWASGLLGALLILPYIPLYGLFLPVIYFPVLSIWYTRKIPDPQPRVPVLKIVEILLSPWMLLNSFIKDIRLFPRELWIAYAIHFAVHVLYVFTIIFLPLFVIHQGYSMILAGTLVLLLSLPFIMSMVSAGLPQASEHWLMIAIGVMLATCGFTGLALVHGSFQAIVGWGVCIMTGYAFVVPALGGIMTAITPKSVVGAGSAVIDISEYGSVLVAAPVIGWSIDAFAWENFFFLIACYCGILAIVVIGIRRSLRIADVRFMRSHPRVHKHPYVL